MHGLLAGHLAERACRQANAQLIDDLQEMQNDLEKAYERNEVDLIEQLNWAFHRTVNYAADAPKVLATLRTVVTQIPTHL